MPFLLVPDLLAQPLFKGLQEVEGNVGGLKVFGVGVGIRQDAKRKAVASLDNVEITSQLEKWKKNADDERLHKELESKG
jgi:hypothetical protein